MSDRIQVDGEALSALMDGELSEFELRRLLAKMSDEPELLATWERYNLVRAVYQPEPLNVQTAAASGADSLSNRIMAAIAEEPGFASATNTQEQKQNVSKKLSTSRWTSQIARLAVAASVAVAVFVGMQSILDTPDMASVASQDTSDFVPAADSNRNVQLAVDADAQQRLNEYIRSVSIPSRPESSEAPFNVLLESPMLHPVSDMELIQEVERTTP